MSNFTVITAINNNKKYKSFFDTSVKMWNNYGFNVNIGCIGDENFLEEIKKIKKEKELSTELYQFNPLKEIDTGIQAKVTRLYLASLVESFIIVDIDMYLLNFNEFSKWFSYYNGNNLVTIGNDMYKDDKFPMCYTIGNGSLLKKIINPNNLNYEQLLGSWKNINNKYDKKEKLGNNFNNFSDESLFRRLIKDSGYKNKFSRVNRIKNNSTKGKKFYDVGIKRIDRYWNWKVDEGRLYKGDYIDCAPKRPLNKNDEVIKKVLKYLNIS